MSQPNKDAFGIPNLSDVLLNEPVADGEALVYEFSTGLWKNTFAPSAPGSFAGLTDTDTAGVASGNGLYFNGSNYTYTDRIDVAGTTLRLRNNAGNALSLPNPGADDALVSNDAPATMKSKTLEGSSTLIGDFSNTYLLNTPVTTANDELLTRNSTQTVTNKTIDYNQNTILNLPADSTTASNVGTVGTGVFKQKTGDDLEFYKLNPGSNKLTVALDGTDKIDLDVAEANLTIANMSDASSYPTKTSADTLQNKTLDNTTVYKDADNSHNLSMPNVFSNDTIVSENGEQTLNKKTMGGNTRWVASGGVGEFIIAPINLAADKTINLESANALTDEFVLRDEVQTIQNKTLRSNTKYRDGTNAYDISTPSLSANATFLTTENPSDVPSYVYGSYYVSTSAPTTPANTTDYIKLLGTTTANLNSADVTHTTNRLTYTGTPTRIFKVMVSASTSAGTNNQNVCTAIFVNGIINTPSVQCRKYTIADDVEEISTNAFVSLSTNDYIEVWVRNMTSVNTVTAEYMAVTMNALT